MELNLVNSQQVKAARFSHRLWKIADKHSHDPFIRRLPLVLTIVGQYVKVLRARGPCHKSLIEDMVSEAVIGLQSHLVGLNAGTIQHDGYLKYLVHNAIAEYLRPIIRERALAHEDNLLARGSHHKDYGVLAELATILPDEEDQIVAELLSEGYTQKDVAYVLGTTEKRVGRMVRDIGVRVKLYLNKGE